MSRRNGRGTHTGFEKENCGQQNGTESDGAERTQIPPPKPEWIPSLFGACYLSHTCRRRGTGIRAVSLDESTFLDHGLAVHLDADLRQDALDADPGVDLPSDRQVVPETEVRGPDRLLRLQMRTRDPSLRVQAEAETAEGASVLAAAVHRVDRRLRADDPARVTVRDLRGGRLSEAILEIHVDDEAARSGALDDRDEELSRGERRDGPLPRAEPRILGNPIPSLQGEGEVRACGGGEMDLARAPQTARGPAHALVAFRPVDREPPMPQHPFLAPRHRDHAGADPIRGAARVPVRHGTGRREQYPV